MPHLARSILMLVGASTIFAARAYSAPNSLVIIVANAPFAGTYKPPATEIICLHAKKQRVYSAAWRDFNAHGAKTLAEAGIEVSNPDQPGAKYGDVRIAFGDPDKHSIVYQIVHEPLTLALNGRGGTIAFEGKTKEGIRLQVTASCADVEEL
jgi:hypothetical protein